MLFATWLVSTRRLSSASVYLAGVRSLHIDRGLPEPMVDTPAPSAHSGYQRSAGPARQARLPITGPLLDVIHQSLSSPSLDHIMFLAACCLVFFGFLRVAEFTCPSAFDPTIHLTATNVSIDPTSTIHLWLKSSQTDPFRQGFMIHIGSSGKPICPVAALHVYLDLRGHVPGPLFVTSTGSPLTIGHRQSLAPVDLHSRPPWFILQQP